MLYLASQSPRRRELLTQLGLEFSVLDVDIIEQRQPGEPPADYVNRVAREKAGAGLLSVMALPDALVLGADTEVVLGEVVYGKPLDDAKVQAVIAEAGAQLAGKGRLVIRPSGTEPVIRVMAEGDDAAEVEAVVGAICAAVQEAAA